MNPALFKYTRKPTNWSDVQATVSVACLPEGLPRWRAAALGIARWPLGSFQQEPGAQYFLVDVGERVYLVNSEGGSYAKYIAEVKPLEPM